MKQIQAIKKLAFLLILIISYHPMEGQEELSLFHYDNVQQSGLLNPSHAAKGIFHIGLGSIYTHADLRGPKWAKLLFGTDFLKDLASRSTKGYLSADAAFHPIDLGFKYNDWYFRGGMVMKMNGYFDFSPDFAKLLVLGNANRIGQTIELGPKLYLRRQSDVYIGASYNAHEYYRFGANLKVISGSLDLSTPRSKMNLTTGEEYYELGIESDYLINLSYNSLNFSPRSLLPFSHPFKDNIGIAADFGFQYRAEHFHVSTSLLDVGFMKWKSNAANFESKGAFEFKGLKLKDVNIDTLVQLKDTLIDAFELNVTGNSYFSYMPTKLILGGEYYRNKWKLGATLYGEFKQDRFLPAVAIHARRKLWKFWDLGFSYAYKNNTYSNLGISSVMQIGWFQVYLLSDNVIGPFLPWSSKKFNVRIGTNLVIPQKAPKEKPIQETAFIF